MLLNQSSQIFFFWQSNTFDRIGLFLCLTNSHRLTFIHAKRCLTDLRLTSLTKSGVRGPDDIYFRHVWLTVFTHGVHGTSRLDTRQQWTSSLFSWMLCLIPLSKTCSFDWLGWNFYRRINLHWWEPSVRQLTMAWFRAKKDERTKQTSHSKLQMSMKRAFICVSGPGPLTTEIFNG